MIPTIEQGIFKRFSRFSLVRENRILIWKHPKANQPSSLTALFLPRVPKCILWSQSNFKLKSLMQRPEVSISLTRKIQQTLNWGCTQSSYLSPLLHFSPLGGLYVLNRCISSFQCGGVSLLSSSSDSEQDLDRGGVW